MISQHYDGLIIGGAVETMIALKAEGKVREISLGMNSAQCVAALRDSHRHTHSLKSNRAHTHTHSKATARALADPFNSLSTLARSRAGTSMRI